MAQHGVGIQFRHARRTDHHGRGPGILGTLAIADAGRGSFGGRARDDANAPGDMPRHDLEHPVTFRVVQTGHFTGHAKDGHPVHAGIYEKVDHAAQAGTSSRSPVEVNAVGSTGAHAFEFHANLLAVRDISASARSSQLRAGHSSNTNMHEIRQAFRAMRAAPIVSAVAILSLALGIGANTAMFSILDSLLLRSLPFASRSAS